MGLAKIIKGTEKMIANRKINEKSNHRDGTFPLALSKLVLATKIDTTTPTSFIQSVISKPFFSSFSFAVNIQRQTTQKFIFYA